MAEVNVHLPTAMKGLTLEVTVTGRREVRARVWLGGILLRLAARVLGCGVEVNVQPRA